MMSWKCSNNVWYQDIKKEMMYKNSKYEVFSMNLIKMKAKIKVLFRSKTWFKTILNKYKKKM